MVNQEYSITELQRANKHVKKLKAWYWSLPMYVVGTVMMVFLISFIDPPFWMKLVLLIGPVLWWVYFVVQGLGFWLPKAAFLKAWEEQQIKRLVEKESSVNTYE